MISDRAALKNRHFCGMLVERFVSGLFLKLCERKDEYGVKENRKIELHLGEKQIEKDGLTIVHKRR